MHVGSVIKYSKPNGCLLNIAVCGRKTKLIFQGGYFIHHTSIFDELEQLSIYILKKERFYTWFAVWEPIFILSEDVKDLVSQMFGVFTNKAKQAKM